MPQNINNKQIQSGLSTKKSQRENDMTNLEIPILIYVLKNFSSEEHPISIGTIGTYMQILTGKTHDPKTIRGKVRLLLALQDDPDEENICESLMHTFGGRIVEKTNHDPANLEKRKQSKFYFEPLLAPADVSLICGAITSNRYLSDEEKNYLISREITLSPLADKTTKQTRESTKLSIDRDQLFSVKPAQLADIKIAELFEKPLQHRASGTMPANLLHHINTLYNAIEKGVQLQLTYGTFDLKTESKPAHAREPKTSIEFRVKNNKPYTLNPYALLWNGGSYYLLATHNGYSNPVHFRVDRIQSVQIQIQDDGSPAPRAPLPEILEPFFPKKSKRELGEFDVAKYTATYPLMRLFNEKNYISCVIECTYATLAILVDTFGSNLRIRTSDRPHTEEELLDFHGKPQTYYAVTIPRVQYDNILQLCLQQHTAITALEPAELVEDIKANLRKSLEKYR